MERMLFVIGRLLTKPHMYFENVPNSFLISMNLAALLMAAFIFNEFLTMPLFCINRSKSFFVNPATLAGSKPANASLRFFLLFNIVLQLKPAWKLSRHKNSNIFLSLCNGTPHSLSWYLTIRPSPSDTHAHLFCFDSMVFGIKNNPVKMGLSFILRHILITIQ